MYASVSLNACVFVSVWIHIFVCVVRYVRVSVVIAERERERERERDQVHNVLSWEMIFLHNYRISYLANGSTV